MLRTTPRSKKHLENSIDQTGVGLQLQYLTLSCLILQYFDWWSYGRLATAFETFLRQAGRRLESGCTAPTSSSFHSKASPILGEVSNALIQWNSLSLCTTRPLCHHMQQLGFTTSRKLLADSSNETPISSPLTPVLALNSEMGEPEKAVSKPSKVQAILKGIKQSPKKVNLVAAVVRGMRVEDALLQLQVTVKRACKSVYKVIHSARANATHNHGLDPDRLLVAEVFVGKGFYRKRVSYHAKGKCGIKVRPECRLTVVLREMTPEEEAEVARLRVHYFRKLTRRERRLVPHKLIETTPVWNRESKPNRDVPDATAA